MAIPFVSAHILPGKGIGDGIIHPILGMDHLFAMLAVGILSIHLKKSWQLPLTFVSVMVGGAIAAVYGLGIPTVELGIAFSVMFLGLAIIFAKRIPFVIAVICTGIFGFFHGHAHGTEMSIIVQPMLYMLGFVLSTISLHLTGIGIGYYSDKLSKYAVPTIGVCVMLLGVLFLI